MGSLDVWADYSAATVPCRYYSYAPVVHLHLPDAHILRYGLLDLHPIKKFKFSLRQVVAHGLNFRARYIIAILERKCI